MPWHRVTLTAAWRVALITSQQTAWMPQDQVVLLASQRVALMVSEAKEAPPVGIRPQGRSRRVGSSRKVR